jgi:hypothetical protein
MVFLQVVFDELVPRNYFSFISAPYSSDVSLTRKMKIFYCDSTTEPPLGLIR